MLGEIPLNRVDVLIGAQIVVGTKLLGKLLEVLFDFENIDPGEMIFNVGDEDGLTKTLLRSALLELSLNLRDDTLL